MTIRRGIAIVATLCCWIGVCPMRLNAAGLGGSVACASTPVAAVLAARDGIVRTGLSGKGFAVQEVRWDPLLRQSWAVVRSCDHADWPLLVMRTNLPASPRMVITDLSSTGRGDAGMPIVRAGDLVRLWRIDEHAHLELMATAEENGAVGARVRVRLVAPKDGDAQWVQPVQYLAGVVRGPADVELEP
ncbi:hypothetical protein [Granulicella arctica]|uniref:Flagella basal body P-ring formation protein FlgA C-terminal domain-containing protein n=1 Tax=Granulicella arctica TaxID=940613 RepID=A0A7Y9TH39_9BACT|nr:hypothetical protein [Granulicella arctica]NYF80154.1 hypothetical protein [Granulicella arctica]